jgi:hypothetical protein
VTKVPGWGEFVLAELTQPFDQRDITYFFPLIHQVEERLGGKPRNYTFDAALDAWYVYARFCGENEPDYGFALAPFPEKYGHKAYGRQFAPDGAPLRRAGLPMPAPLTYTNRTTCLIEHERGNAYASLPLRFPKATAKACPVGRANCEEGRLHRHDAHLHRRTLALPTRLCQ